MLNNYFQVPTNNFFSHAFNITISGSGAAGHFFFLDIPPGGKHIQQQYTATTEASGNSFCLLPTGQSLLSIIRGTCSVWTHSGTEIVTSDGGNGRGRGSCKSRVGEKRRGREEMEWVGGGRAQARQTGAQGGEKYGSPSLSHFIRPLGSRAQNEK